MCLQLKSHSFCYLVILMSFLTVGFSCSTSTQLNSQQEAILDEIVSADDTFSALTPSDSRAYFIYTSPGTNMLAYCTEDGKNEVKIVKGTQGTWSISKWSPSQRYLIFQIREPKFQNYPRIDSAKRSWLMLLDASNHSVRRLTSFDAVIESDPMWLDDTSIVFTTLELDQASSVPSRMFYEMQSGDVKRCEQMSKFAGCEPIINAGIRLIKATPKCLYFVDNGQLCLLDWKVNRTTRFIQTTNMFSSEFQWMNPSPSGSNVLFCATPFGVASRYLFKSSFGGQAAKQMSSVHSYNGKWLADDSSFAFVGNTNNCFYLAIHPANSDAATNLFNSGWCRTYTPSPDGEKVYAEASIDSGPCGLWEYDIRSRQLRLLAPGNRIPFSRAKIVVPEMVRVPSFDGFQIPVYTFRSVQASNRQKPSATIIAIPPRTDQCSRYYQTRPQFLANLGFDYIGINYRGCDGYGTEYSRLYDLDEAAKDVVAVVRHLVGSGSIAAGPLILTGQSEGCDVLSRVLAIAPELWSAGVLVRGSLSAVDALQQSHIMPPLRFIIGENDPAFELVKKNIGELKQLSWPAKGHFIPNYTHLNVDPIGRRAEEETLASFVLEILRDR